MHATHPCCNCCALVNCNHGLPICDSGAVPTLARDKLFTLQSYTYPLLHLIGITLACMQIRVLLTLGPLRPPSYDTVHMYIYICIFYEIITVNHDFLKPARKLAICSFSLFLSLFSLPYCNVSVDLVVYKVCHYRLCYYHEIKHLCVHLAVVIWQKLVFLWSRCGFLPASYWLLNSVPFVFCIFCFFAYMLNFNLQGCLHLLLATHYNAFNTCHGFKFAWMNSVESQ